MSRRHREGKRRGPIQDKFHAFAVHCARAAGAPLTFVLAAVLILIWAITGPIFGFSDTWQLVINTGTTIITFLIVFLVQNTQTRDAEVIHLKLDELIRALKGARSSLIDLEEMSEPEIKEIEEEFRRRRAKVTSRKR